MAEPEGPMLFDGDEADDVFLNPASAALAFFNSFTSILMTGSFVAEAEE